MPEELGFEAISVAVPTHGDDVPTLVYRPLTPMDVHQCRELHAILFPIQYEEDFFTKTVNGCDGIFSFAAFVDWPDGPLETRLVGVITTRICTEQDPDARFVLHQPDRASRPDRVLAYILTLGVHPDYRRQGIASELLERTVRHCRCMQGCQSVFLHVIDYNREAMSFYSRHAFSRTRLIKEFYFIRPGPMLPVRNKELFDAYIYALYMHGGRPPQPVLDSLVGSVRTWWTARVREAAALFYAALAATCSGARLGPGGAAREPKGEAHAMGGGGDGAGEAADESGTALGERSGGEPPTRSVWARLDEEDGGLLPEWVEAAPAELGLQAPGGGNVETTAGTRWGKAVGPAAAGPSAGHCERLGLPVAGEG